LQAKTQFETCTAPPSLSEEDAEIGERILGSKRRTAKQKEERKKRSSSPTPELGNSHFWILSKSSEGHL